MLWGKRGLNCLHSYFVPPFTPESWTSKFRFIGIPELKKKKGKRGRKNSGQAGLG